ncbi:MAG: PHP domain-containing protein [Anaerolineales bacterium]|nr:PHP domain-containing protein [Anaerolineales bacterium]
MTKKLRTEFHCHTVYSKDSLTRPDELVRACRRKGIDRVVITDHNTTVGARKAREFDPDLVIVGEEIMTTGGEILAAYVTEEVPAGLSPQETIRRLKDQGAFISVSHPFDVSRRGSWKVDDLRQILPLVDAIEVFNSRCWLPLYNRQAADFARRYDLAGTVGSDAHAVLELGRATLLLPPFRGADDLRTVIRQGTAESRWSFPIIHFISRYAAWRKSLGGLPGKETRSSTS